MVSLSVWLSLSLSLSLPLSLSPLVQARHLLCLCRRVTRSITQPLSAQADPSTRARTAAQLELPCVTVDPGATP